LNITPHLIVFRSFSHQTAVDKLVKNMKGKCHFEGWA